MGVLLSVKIPRGSTTTTTPTSRSGVTSSWGRDLPSLLTATLGKGSGWSGGLTVVLLPPHCFPSPDLRRTPLRCHPAREVGRVGGTTPVVSSLVVRLVPATLVYSSPLLHLLVPTLVPLFVSFPSSPLLPGPFDASHSTRTPTSPLPSF